MSTVLSSKEGVKARKAHRCCFCGEAILIGDTYDVRRGVNSDGHWTMCMHPECHAFESPKTVDCDWYEDVSEPAFGRPLAAPKSEDKTEGDA